MNVALDIDTCRVVDAAVFVTAAVGDAHVGRVSAVIEREIGAGVGLSTARVAGRLSCGALRAC